MRRAVQPPRDFFWGLITGHALSLRKSRLNYMYACLKQYGDFMEMYLGKKRTLLVNDPVGLKYVLFDHSKNYPKNTPGYQRVAEVLGQGVFTDIGEEWKNGRRAIAPTFNPSKFDHYFSLVSDETKNTILRMKNSRSVDGSINMSSWSTRYALHVIGRSLFNETLENSFDIISKKLSHLIDLTEKKMTYITPFQTLSKRALLKDFNLTLKILDEEIEKIIAKEKIKERKPKENMIHALLESPLNFTDKKILSQVKTMIFAGHETTANVIIWSFYFLARYPQWQDKIYAEFRDRNFSISGEDDLKNFLTINLFLKEVLRMRPPAWSFGRVAISEDRIHGEVVHPGDLISISPFLIHHHPDFWENPEAFEPDRFLKEPTPYTFIPFGAGPRICMGERLANLEMCMFLLQVIKEFKLTNSSKSINVQMNAQVSLRPDQDIYLELEERQ
ncbi:MAG: cytochrome P450 [Bacteriovorax sp.]|nr:cytochrome P450 [Bacteriovorax sp.]